MRSIQKFLLEDDDNEVIEIGPYMVPRQIVKKGKGAVEGYISKVKKKLKIKNSGFPKMNVEGY
jgi:hypothetical protein